MMATGREVERTDTEAVGVVDQTAVQFAAGQALANDQLALAGTAHIIGNSLETVAEFAWESQLWAEGRRNGVRLSLQLQFLF